MVTNVSARRLYTKRCVSVIIIAVQLDVGGFDD